MRPTLIKMTDYGTSKIEGILQRIERKIDSLQKQVDELKPQVSSDAAWLTIKELSEYIPTNPSESTIRRMVRAQVIPYSRAGKRLLFQKSDIDNWLLNSKSKSVGQVEADDHKALASIRKQIAPWRMQSA